MDNNTEITRITGLLTEKLRDYLLIKGVKINESGFFSCIHPDHPDHNPSSHIIAEGPGNNKVFYCFSGQHCGNIFHAAHFLEGKPINGIGFYEDTLKYLCNLFQIEYEPVQISEDVKREYQKRRAYQDATNVVHAMAFHRGELKKEHPGIKHLLERGITEETIRKFKIGCIDSFSGNMKELQDLGWSDKDWLGGADLANKGLFNKDGIIIPIFEQKKGPVGFVTRNNKFKQDDKGHQKYMNSLNSDIYHKSEILFNFNNCKRESGPLYIVEGYLDAVYLTQAGIPNVVAIGATVLTEPHVDMLVREGYKDIYLWLDPDEAGNKGVKLAIERLSIYKAFRIKILECPEGFDPDSYIRTNGMDALDKLKEEALMPFFWTLKHTTFEDDPMEIVANAVPTIAMEDRHITRLQMIKQLSQITGISDVDIKKDVESCLSKESSVYIEELKLLNDYVRNMLQRRKVQDTKTILQEAVIKVKSLDDLYNKKLDNKSDWIERIAETRDKISEGKFEYGLKTPHFPKFEKKFDGIPFWTCLTTIGGRPSAGKTMFMIALSMDIIESNEDAALFFMSIDDTVELVLQKMIAMRSGLSTSEIKRYTKLDSAKKRKIDAAWEWVDKYSDRYIIADASVGNNVETMEMHIDWFNKNFEDKRKLVLLDNFHKLRVQSSKIGKKTESISDLSERIKDFTQLNNMHIMMTVELRKGEDSRQKPTISDLKDSVQMEYDSDIIMMVHNEKQADQATSIGWIGKGETQEELMPFIEINVAKNKITGIHGDLVYKLNTYNLDIIETTLGEVKVVRDKANKNRNVGTIKASRTY